MKILKRFFIFSALLVVLLAVWIHIGSIDQESFDDRGLLSELKPVPDAENGFLDIAYMRDEKFSISGEESLKDFSRGEAWDSGKVEAMLLANKGVIDSVEKSNKKISFKLPEFKGIWDAMFPYQHLVEANRLIIIQSREHAQSFDYNKTIDSIRQSLLFSAHVKQDKNGYLISWAIGLAMQSDILSWIYELVSRYELSSEQYIKLISLLNDIEYSPEEFSNVFMGEYRFGMSVIKEPFVSTIQQRFKYYLMMSQIRKKYKISVSMKEIIFSPINLLFPAYFTHINGVSNRYADSMFLMQEKTSEFCSGIKFQNIPERASYDVYGQSFFELLKPNSMGKQAIEAPEAYWSYFQRRCFFHVYADAVKTVVALKAYEKKHGGGLPKNLDMLVPDYLDRLPIDYFDGKPLRYSIENDWLYSVGADYKDDGGSLDSFYQGKCDKEKPCFNNPTIPLTAPQAAQ